MHWKIYKVATEEMTQMSPERVDFHILNIDEPESYAILTMWWRDEHPRCDDYTTGMKVKEYPLAEHEESNLLELLVMTGCGHTDLEEMWKRIQESVEEYGPHGAGNRWWIVG